MLKHRIWKEWGYAFGLWTLMAVGMAVQLYLYQRMGKRPVAFADALRQQVAYGWTWAALTPLLVAVLRAIRRRRLRWYAALPVHGLTAMAFAALQRALVMLVYRPPSLALSWWSYLQSYLWFVDYGILFYALFLLLEWVAEGRVKAAQLEAQLAQAQLEALRMQLNPHFLFNTLNSISSLVREDPDSAERTIARLGELLRTSLENAKTADVTLRQELEFLDRYLEIERIRFEERLRLEIRIDPRTLDARVPNLILQPLVENAIRHGIARRPEGGSVTIESELAGDRLVLRVTDDGVGLPGGGPQRNGVGLENTRARLERIYGSAHEFSIVSGLNGGAAATITVPYEPLRLSDGEVPRGDRG